MSIRASVFDIAEAAVAEDVAANTHLSLVLTFEAYRCNFKKLFEVRFSCR